jgi:hypothetical protein
MGSLSGTSGQRRDVGGKGSHRIEARPPWVKGLNAPPETVIALQAAYFSDS